MYFVAMPPGWHVTNGPGALLYPSGTEVRGNFVIESEIFLFPGTTTNEYGVFIGGSGLDSASLAPRYVAFVGRRDGRAAILRTGATAAAIPANWQENTALLPQAGADAVKNVLRVEVTPTHVIFSGNGKEILREARAGFTTDGAVGFRLGKDVNVHITTFDITRRFAPAPIKKEM
jgi:hypothetical protein